MKETIEAIEIVEMIEETNFPPTEKAITANTPIKDNGQSQNQDQNPSKNIMTDTIQDI